MAQKILDDYFEKYKGVDQYIKDTTLFALQNGYAKSFFGFKRRVPAINSEDEGLKAQAARQAVNATIQNPASISLLLSICNMQEEIDEMVERGELRHDDIQILGTIHDAAYCQVTENLLLLARDLLLKHMTAPPMENCPVPIRAEAEWGKSWDAFDEDFGTAMVDEEDSEDEDEDDLEDAA